MIVACKTYYILQFLHLSGINDILRYVYCNIVEQSKFITVVNIRSSLDVCCYRTEVIKENMKVS